MEAWGTGKWGTGRWAGVGVPLSVLNAVAIGTTIVRVTLSTEPLNGLRSVYGDALNPWIWSVRRLDTYEQFTIGEIARVSRGVYDIHTFEPFADFLTDHSVATVDLLSLNDDVVVAPKSALFRGVLADILSTPEAALATRRRGLRDIANPPTAQPDGSLGGTRVIAGGDYIPEQGAALLFKMVMRRLSTLFGGFFHLPTFGAGVAEKEPVRIADMPQMQKQIEQQLLEEQDVTAVKAKLTLTSDGVLTIRINVKSPLTGAGWTPYTIKRLPDGTLSLAA